jgi:radical SAM superfamily enzyme YgiQ (UPF0313 family)
MVGFEFGTQQALDAVKKGTTLEHSRRLAKEARRLGFTVHGCFMFGAPGETRESAMKTIEFAKSLHMDTVQFSGICAYPGSEIYNWSRNNDFLVPKTWRQWLDENWEQVTVLSYPEFNKEEIDRLIDRGLKEFYLKPRQMMRMVQAIQTVDDLKRKLYGLKMFIEGFLFRRGSACQLKNGIGADMPSSSVQNRSHVPVNAEFGSESTVSRR